MLILPAPFDVPGIPHMAGVAGSGSCGYGIGAQSVREPPMITCHVRYVVDQDKLAEFEIYSRMWLALLPKFGGVHHGYFLPAEGASDEAFCLFSFDSLAAYEQYRLASASDPEVAKAIAYAKETRCFLRHERSFYRPLLP